MFSDKNIALEAERDHRTAIETAEDYIENFDILETITNVGNDEVFTPAKTCKLLLDSLPDDVWNNPNYKWLNPASKNGIFEREIAIRLNEGLKDIIPNEEERKKHILQNMIYSFGQTKFTANVARRTLYYCSDANRKCDGIKANDGHFVNGYAIGNGSWFETKEGNIKTPETVHRFIKDGRKYKCMFCGIDKDSMYADPLQREQYAYEFIHVEKQSVQKLINKRFNGGKDMKIDIIIGNPPYQLSDGGNGQSARPIYQLFVERAKELNPKYLSFIIPSRWFTGGKGLDDFRKEMLLDKSIRKIYDYENYKDVFPALGGLAGGACYFLWDRDYKGDCEIYNCTKDDFNVEKRALNEFPVLVRANKALPIIRKIRDLNKDKAMLDSFVSSRNPFGLKTNYKPLDEGIPCWFTQKTGLKYADANDVDDSKGYLDKWKLLAPKSPIAGQTDFSKSVGFYYEGNTVIAKPGECCTDTFIVLGAFDSQEETLSYRSYIFTKTVRFLLLQTVVSQDVTRKNFIFIPHLGKYEGIYSDEQLVKKWGITKDEWEYINYKIHNYGKDIDIEIEPEDEESED